MLEVTISAHGGWMIGGMGGMMRKTGIVGYGILSKKDYVFDTKQEAEQFLEEWLDGWSVMQISEPEKSQWKKTWYIKRDKENTYLHWTGETKNRCGGCWYKTKEDAENVLYKYLSTKFQEKNMSSNNLQERLKQAIKDRDSIDSNIAEIKAEIKKEIEKAKKVNWEDLPKGTVVESLSSRGYYAAVFLSNPDREKRLMGIKGNFHYETLHGCLPYFDSVRIIGNLSDYINIVED